jgi:hypothetical protein
MAPVVDDDVKFRNLVTKAFPERSVGLVADEDARRSVLVPLALRLVVDAVDMTPLAEVVVPHV